MYVNLKKIPVDFSEKDHRIASNDIENGKYDGLSISCFGSAFGPTWSRDQDYDLSFLKFYENIKSLEIHLPGLNSLDEVGKYLRRSRALTYR